MALRDEPVATGKWWRFSRYEIRELRRRSIAPAPRARLMTFDPFERRADKPHLSFVQVVKEFEPYRLSSPADPGRQSAEQRLLDWCNEYGLLGILFHRAVIVTLAARWMRYPGTPDGQAKTPVVAQCRRYIRRNDAWLSMWHSASSPLGDPADEGHLVSPDQLPTDFPRPGALIETPFGEELRDGRFVGVVPSEEPLSATWSEYFTDVPEWERDTYAYPEPRSREFAEHYVEPLSDILIAGLHLGGILDIIVQRQPDDPFVVQHGIGALSHLASYGAFALEPGPEKGLRQQWFAGSLLAALAYMAAEDLAEGELRQCGNERCRKLFHSKAWQARYCSLRCQNATQARRFRQKRREQPSARSKTKRR
jgi:hypothetical protein